MSDDTYTIRVNQFTDGATGHVNISYISSDGTFVTYGNNVSPSSGVQVETTQTLQRIGNNPSAYSYADIPVSAQQFASSLAATRAVTILNNSFFGLCNNCADFANEALKAAGLGEWSLANFLKDRTLTRTYITAAQYICGNEYVDRAKSAVANILASPQNVAAAVQFVAAMDWLSQPTGSEFYAQYSDPDTEAADRFAQLKAAAKKLGISVKYDPIQNKITLGVGSPIVLDLDGDGIRTTSYATASVMFDIDGDGDRDRTAWISTGDAFLAIDRNGNGRVDGVGELFGGLRRGEGYAKLSELDANGDRAITPEDKGYELLGVWRDANGNGITDDGELTSASAAGIERLELAYATQTVFDANDNLIGEVSSARVKGQSIDMADVYFRYKSVVAEHAHLGQRTNPADTGLVHALVSAMASFEPPSAVDGIDVARAPLILESRLAVGA